MNTLRRRLSLSVTFVLTTALPLVAQETFEIKPRWQVGKKFSQTMQMDQTSTMAFGEQKIDQKTAMTMDASMSVRPHENGKHKRIDVKYDRVATTINTGAQTINYDSGKPPDSDPLGLGKAFGAIVGKEVRIIVDEKDEVLEVENFDAMMKEMAAGNPMAAMIGQMLNKDAMKNMMRQNALYGAPGRPVKVGDSWPFDYTMPMPQIGKVAMGGTYTLKGAADRGGARCAEIALNGKLEMDLTGGAEGNTEASAALKQLGITIKGGRVYGTLWFDLALGLCRDVEFTQDMTMQMNNPQKPEEKIEIPMRQIIKQRVTKVENL